MLQELENSKEEKIKDPDENLTNALKDVSNQIVPEYKKDTRIKSHTRNEIILKPVTNLTLEEAEWKWGCKLKDEAIKLEGKLRERAINYPNEPITEKVKDEIIWTVVNEEKQKETVSAILEKITDLINKGLMPKKEEIAQMIEESPNKKYLDIESLLKQASFVKEAKTSIGTMHEETRKSLVKYIVSNKDVLKLKEFFEKYTLQKQIDKIVAEKDSVGKSKEEKEKDALLEIGEFFLKTQIGYKLNDIKEIAKVQDLDEFDFVEKSKQLIKILKMPNTNPDKLDKLVENLIYREEKRKQEEREVRTQYLNQIGKNLKEINNLDLAKIANENRIPLGIIKEEAQALIKRMRTNKQQTNPKTIKEIIEEMVQ